MPEKLLKNSHWWFMGAGLVMVLVIFIFSYFFTQAAPANPSSLQQYGPSTSTAITNGAWVTNGTVNLQATSSDATDPFLVYYQLITSPSSFTTATTAPASFCKTGTTFSSCGSGIWANATTTTGWFDKSYKYRQPITVQAARVGGSLTNFPIYLEMNRLGSTNNFWTHTKRNSDGGDILITNSSGTRMPVEIVSISTSSKTGEVYFRADAISSSSNPVFYLYYGSSTASQPASSTTFGARGVWTNSYISVYHLNNSNFKDSVGSFNGTNVGTTATTSKFGGANGARSFDGATTGINLGNLTALTNMTLSAWISPKPTQVANAKIVAKTTPTAAAPYSIYNLTYDASTPQHLRTEIDVGGTQYGLTGTTGIVSGSYNYVASTYDGANLRFYYNGAAQGTPVAISGSLAGDTDPTQIGRSYFGGTAIKEWFRGAIDEVRIVSVARSPKWLSTEYNNMSSPGTFYTTTTPEQYYLTNNKKAVKIISLPDSTASTTGYKWQSLACDSSSVCSKNWTAFNAASPNFKVDTSVPTAPGALTPTASTTASMTLKYGATSTEDAALFRQYKIYYRVGTSTPIHETDLLWGSSSDANLRNINFNRKVTTTVTGLSFATRYSFSIWAYDYAGNKSSSTLSTGITAGNPVPTTVSVSPATKNVYDAQFTITVKGTNFIASSVVKFNGSSRTTTFSSSTQLTATILASDLLKATTTDQITVFNPSPFGGTSNAQSFTVNYPVPTTVSISPATKTVGDAQFVMTIKGADFVTSSVARYNGSNLTTTFSSSTQLTATIPATDMLKATTTAAITVFNTTPGGGTSNAQTFTVNNPIPTTVSISPNTKTVGDAQFTVIIKGTNFVATSQVQFNGSNRTTTFASSTQLTATIPASDMTNATTTAQITVVNPAPGGGTSNAQTFTVNNPIPTTVSISPNTKTVGDAQFTMTIKGTNFVNTSVAQFNGSALSTIFASSTQLTATIPATDMLKATTTAAITVFNTTPGGGTSNAQTFTVNNPIPTTVSISPNTKTVGDAQFTMTIKGTNFVNTSVVRFNGSDRVTSYSSSTQLTATIPASDMLTASDTIQITVFNPAPGGGTSNAQTFTVNATAPTTVSISPDTKTVGDAQFIMTVKGTNFLNSSIVRFNGADRATSFSSSTQLTVVIPASDMLSATTTAEITVFNPVHGDTSNAQIFTVNNPVPTTISITPHLKTVGDSQFTMTVKGTNFVNTSVARFNGSDRATSYSSSTELTATIPASDLTVVTSTAEITVFNPVPGGGTSNAQTFTVTSSAPVATKFVIVQPADGTVDAPIVVTVKAEDALNNVVTNYQQDVTLLITGSATGGGLINIVNGVGTTSISDQVAETVHLSLSDTQSTGLDVSSASTAVFAAGVTAAFSLNNPGNIIAGNRAAYVVTRKDQYGNLTTQGNTTVYLYSTSNGVHQAFYDAGVNGNLITSVIISSGNTTAGFWYYDEKAGNWIITASDNSIAPDGNAGIQDAAAAIEVIPGPTSQYTLNNPGGMTAGTRQGYLVSRLDQYGNSVTSTSETVYLYSNSSGANYKFYDAAAAGTAITSAALGNGSSTAAFWYYDDKAGNWTITASDNSSAPDGITGIIDASVSVTVSAAATYKYLLDNPGDMTAGTLLGYTVTREDQFANLVTAGQDNVYLFSNSTPTAPIFYSTDGTSSPVSSVSITDGNSETNFWYFDQNVGAWTVTGSDNSAAPDGAAGIIDATDTVNVSAVPIVATKFIIVNPIDGTVGDHINVTIKAVDNNNNVDGSYQNGVTLLASGAATGGGLVDIVNGVGTAVITDTVAETVNLSLSDTQTTGLDISSTQDLVFAAGPVYKFILSNPAGIVAGTRADYTVKREDQFGNLITTGNTAVYLYSDSNGINKRFYDAAIGGSAISLINISPGNSAADFWYYDEKSGNWQIRVSDNSTAPDGPTGILDAQDVLAVASGAVTEFVLNNPGNMTAGTRLGFEVSRRDQFSNPVTAGTNVVYLYSNSTGTTTKFFDAATLGGQITSVSIANASSTANFWYYDNTAGIWTVTASDNSVAPDGVAGIVDGSDSVTVTFIPVTATKFVIINPANGRAGDHIAVEIEAQDNLGNVDNSYEQGVTLVTSGAASGGGLVSIVNGVGVKVITDAVAETVNLSLSDTEATGLDVSSIQNVIFAAVGGSSGGQPAPVSSRSVPQPLSLTIKGEAFAAAQILVSQVSQGMNVLKETGSAASDGSFSITVTGFSAGDDVFSLLAKDKDGRETQARIFNVSFNLTTVEIDKVIIPPTIDLVRSVLTRGDFIKVIGYAAPNNQVTVLLDNGQTYSVTSDSAGAYQILVNTAALPYGTHTVKVRQIDNITGVAGEYSLTRNFIVSSSTLPSADFNNDGKIDVQDWSIFLILWQKKDPRSDLNGDGKIDISDLSIFLQAAKIK